MNNGDLVVSQPESSVYEYPITPALDYPSESRFVQVYQDQVNNGTLSPPSDGPMLTDIFGKVIDVVGKTATDIYKVKYAQPTLKQVPVTQSGIEKYLMYPQAQTRQTGLNTGTSLVNQSPSLLSGFSTSSLAIIVIIVIGAFLAMRA